MSRHNIIFMGSPSFAVPTLEALIESADFDVSRVVTQPDRPKGRGKKLAPTAVKAAAIERNIATSDMTKDNYAHVAAELEELAPDFIVVVAFGVILMSDLLDLPRLGCINLHASILPKYRGVSPIHTAILAGDAEAGCTTMVMDEGIDTGGVLQTVTTPIEASDTTGSLEARLAALGAPMMIDTLTALRDGTIVPIAQDEAAATYTRKIRKQRGRMNWEKPAVEIERQIRAMQPWPTAFTGYGGRRLIVVEATLASAAQAAPGTVISTSPLVVAAGEGALELRRVKPEGKREMDAASFAAGYRVAVGGLMKTPEA